MIGIHPFYRGEGYEFYRTREGVFAKCPDFPPVPVKIPNELPAVFSGCSIHEKLERLVEEGSFEMVHDEFNLSFHPREPTPLKLEQETELSIPKGTEVFCFGNSGAIYYAFFNTVYRWNPFQNVVTSINVGTSKITSIAEFSNGRWVAGDENCILHYPDGSKVEIMDKPTITKILPLSETRCILCFRKDSGIFDVETRSPIQPLNTANPIVIGEDRFLLTDKNLCLATWSDSLGKYYIEKKFDQSETLIRKLSDSHVLLTNKNTLLFNIADGSSTLFPGWKINNAAKKGPISLVGNGEGLFHMMGRGNGADVGLTYVGKETKVTPLSGWGVDALLPLSKSMTLCATNPRNSRIYILSNEDGSILFDDEGTLTKGGTVSAFHSRSDGSIVVQFEDRLSIIQLAPLLGYFYKKRISLKVPDSKKRILDRLFVGEGSFTGVEALIKKHKKDLPELTAHITATELGMPIKPPLFCPKRNPLPKRLEKLEKSGVKILFGVDATKLEEKFPKTRFERIQWNHPFGGAKPKEREEFKKVIPAFFQSCRKMQLNGDRVHVTLHQPGIYWTKRQVENPIVEGSVKAGYRLIRERRFGITRYPGYEHNKTGKTQAFLHGDDSREFVFEKADFIPQEGTIKERAEALKDPDQKEYRVGEKEKGYYFECSSDDESSEYFE